MPRQNKAIIIEDFEDHAERLEEKIETFLNSKPKKEIINISMSSLGIKHFVLIVYREG